MKCYHLSKSHPLKNAMNFCPNPVCVTDITKTLKSKTKSITMVRPLMWVTQSSLVKDFDFRVQPKVRVDFQGWQFSRLRYWFLIVYIFCKAIDYIRLWIYAAELFFLQLSLKLLFSKIFSVFFVFVTIWTVCSLKWITLFRLYLQVFHFQN